MDKDSKDFMAWIDALAKGIIAGCAIGYLFSLTDLLPAGGLLSWEVWQAVWLPLPSRTGRMTARGKAINNSLRMETG